MKSHSPNPSTVQEMEMPNSGLADAIMRIWDAANSDDLPGLWAEAGAGVNQVTGGCCAALFASSPAGDALEQKWPHPAGPPVELPEGQALDLARSRKPLLACPEGETLLSIRAAGRLLALAYFPPNGPLFQRQCLSDMLSLAGVAGAALEGLRRRRGTAILTGLQDALDQAGDARQRIRLLLENALEESSGQWGFVAAVSEAEPDWLHLVESRAGRGILVPDRIPTEYDIVERLLKSRQPVVVNTLEPGKRHRLWKRGFQKLSERYGRPRTEAFLRTLERSRRCAGYPLILDGRTVGVLAVHHDDLGRFSLDDLARLDPLADRLAVELFALRALTKEACRLADLGTPGDLLTDVQALSPIDARNELFRQLTERALEEVARGAYRAAITAYVPQLNELSLDQRVGPWSKKHDSIHLALTDTRSTAVAAFNTNRTVAVHDTRQEGSPYYPDVPEGEKEDPTLSTVAIPIRNNQTVLGVLVVDWRYTEGCDEVTVHRLEHLVDAYAMPIARYYTVSYLDKLEGLLHRIEGTAIRDEHCEEFLELAAAVTGARVGCLFLRDPRTGLLQLRARTHGKEGLAKDDLAYEFGEGLTGTVALRQEIVRLPSLELDDLKGLRAHGIDPSVLRRKLPDHRQGSSNRRSFLAVPMCANGEVVGLLRLRGEDGQPFTSIDEEMAQVIAGRFGAVLYQSLERARSRELRLFASRHLTPAQSAIDLAALLFDHVERLLGPCDLLIRLADWRPAPGHRLVEVLRRIKGKRFDKDEWHALPITEDPSTREGWAWANRDELLLPDLSDNADPRVRLAPLEPALARGCELYLPVRAAKGGDVQGLLVVRKAVPHAFSKGEIDFLRRAADLAIQEMLRHREVRVNQLIGDLEIEAHECTRKLAGGKEKLPAAERDFYRNALVKLMKGLRALEGHGFVGVPAPGNSRLEFFDVEGNARGLSEEAQGRLGSLLAGSGGEVLVCPAGDLFPTVGGIVPASFATAPAGASDCYILPMASRHQLLAAFFLFDDNRQQVSYARAEQLQNRMKGIVHVIELARKNERQRETSLLMSAVGLIGAMVLNVHHDLRGPIRRARINLQSIPEGQRFADYDDVMKDLDLVLAAVQNLVDFVHDSKTPKTDIALREVLEEAHTRVEQEGRLQRLAHRIHRNLRGADPLVVFGLQKPLVRAFEHLFNNGLSAIDGKEEGRIDVTAKADGSMVAVTVTDNGVGMSPETKSRMFELFFKVGHGGSGLGMSAVNAIVEFHQGHIDVASVEGAGTTITLYLPTGGGK